jgi:hypothetical protein
MTHLLPAGRLPALTCEDARRIDELRWAQLRVRLARHELDAAVQALRWLLARGR